MTFAQMLRQWVKKHKLTQQQAAAHLNVAFRSFQEWLAGDHEPHPDRRSIVEQRMKSFDENNK